MFEYWVWNTFISQWNSFTRNKYTCKGGDLGSVLKGKNLLPGEQILLEWSRPLLKRGLVYRTEKENHSICLPLYNGINLPLFSIPLVSDWIWQGEANWNIGVLDCPKGSQRHRTNHCLLEIMKSYRVIAIFIIWENNFCL